MAIGSGIEWTEATWNPVTGCTKVSAGCKNCYAERMAKRLRAMGARNYRNGFRPTMHEHMLEVPLGWRQPRKVFVNSMSDLFHAAVSEEFIHRVFGVMRRASQHQFQVLTKRPERVREMSARLDWAPNVWMGVSVESELCVGRIDDLRRSGARVKFLSLEPLIGPLDGLPLEGIDWVIVGGESGPHSRPIQEEWVVSIQRQCSKSGVAFFFKQWGGVRKKSTGRTLLGRTWDEFPRNGMALAGAV